MIINYIILAHKRPEQLRRLVQSLSSTRSRFYIHIDKNCNADPFIDALTDINNVTFMPEPQRRDCTWGSAGYTEAVLEFLKKIVIEDTKGYCVVISGQDYPIKNKAFIENFFERNYGKTFMTIWEIPYENWRTGGMNRLNRYKIDRSTKRFDFVLLSSIFEREFYTLQTARKIISLFKVGKFKFLTKLLKKRRHTQLLKPYGGLSWWALPMETAKQIVEFANRNPKYLKYHEYSLLPEEMFFHTIIMNLENEKLRLNIRPYLTYSNWKKGASPKILTSKDLSALKEQQEMLFARKFDVEVDKQILDLIDEELLKANGDQI